MKLLIFASLITYVLISSYFFLNWLRFFKRSYRSSPENWFLSMVLLAIAVLFWPFVVPFSLIASASSFITKRLLSATSEPVYQPEPIPTALIECVDLAEKA